MNRKDQQPQPHPPRRRDTHTIAITLTVPKSERVEKVAKKSLAITKKAWRRRRVRFAAAGLAVFGIAVITVTILTQRETVAEGTTKGVPLVTEVDKTATVPQFTTLIPNGKTIEQLGGWTRVSPPDRNAVFAYSDSVGDKRVIVSEQPLPEDFKTDTDIKIKELAVGYKATEKLTVDGLIVYIGTSAKGPQSVILAKNDVLLLLKSSVLLTNDEWIRYISDLQ